MQARRQVRYLPGDRRLYDRLTAREQLDSLARLRGGVDAKLRNELCERFGVVQAFMDRPQLVILDEPTAGLDPLLQAEFRDLLRETAAAGRTVFLSSHSLDEVQHVADRIIRSGRLVDVDSVERLRERALRDVTVVFAEPVDVGAFDRLDGVGVERSDGRSIRLSAPEPALDSSFTGSRMAG